MNKDVLVIRMTEGAIDSVVDESRNVYKNSKGEYIKTVSDGTIYLDAANRAVISYRRQTGRNGYACYHKTMESQQTVETALHQFFLAWGLDSFIK
jgi:hypothetical protein